MNRWKEAGLKRYWSLTTDFLDFILEKCPGDSECEDMKLFHSNVISSCEKTQNEGITAWIESMEESLLKRVKYAKAVERIMSGEDSDVKTAVVFHALAYRDIEGMYSSSTSTVLQRLALNAKMKLDSWTSEDTTCMWKYMDEINRAAYDSIGKEPPRVPSRDEIAKNIKTNKRGASDGHSMYRAFHVAVRSLAEMRNSKKTELSDATVELVKAAFARALANEDLGLASKIESNDASCLVLLCKEDAVFESVLGDAVAPMSASEWQLLTQMLGLTQVNKAVPTAMMETIESYAKNLASDVMEGRRDFSQMNIEEMGAEVMAQLNPDDVDHMASNVDGLQNVLSTLTRGMGIPMPPMPPSS